MNLEISEFPRELQSQLVDADHLIITKDGQILSALYQHKRLDNDAIIAFELMEKIANAESDKHGDIYGNDPRDYDLSLYKQCLEKVTGDKRF